MKKHIHTTNDYYLLKSIYDSCHQVINMNNVSWEAKYDFVFSGIMSKTVFKIAPNFDYYDPDTSYEEDTTAFVSALEKYINEITII